MEAKKKWERVQPFVTYIAWMLIKGWRGRSYMCVYHAFLFNWQESHMPQNSFLSASYFLVFCSTLHSRITKIKNIINLVWLFWHVLVIIGRMRLELVRKFLLKKKSGLSCFIFLAVLLFVVYIYVCMLDLNNKSTPTHCCSNHIPI